MRNFYIVVLLVLIGFGAHREANAMRCNGKIIGVGDTSYNLTRQCGEPLAVLRGVFDSRVVYIYEMNGREQRIVVIDGIIKGGI